MTRATDMPERHAELTPARRALLEKRVQDALASVGGSQAIQRRARPSLIPLSFAQQRLWFLDQLEPSSLLYLLPTAFRLAGPLNVEALKQSLNEIVRRHEALRTTFPAVDGQPVQVIAPAQTVALRMVDLRPLPEAERQAEADRLAQEDAQRRFDLGRGPLLRASLLCLDDREHVLLLNMHHIVFDGWSRGLLFKELSSLYAALSSGRPSPLRDLPVQYADFSLWQREWLQGEVLEEQLGYWKQQLGGAPSVLALPSTQAHGARPSYRSAVQPLILPQPLAEALRTLSRREGVTLFMTLLAAFQTLLYRYTRQTDVVVGSPIANRNRLEIEGLIGFFANTLAFRSDLSGNPSFRALLRRVEEVCLGAYAHQDLPFERLVEELHPQRDLSHSPLFQVMLAFQNTPRHALEMPGLWVSRLELDVGWTPFDLTLSLMPEAGQLTGQLKYRSDLFNGDTIRRMVDHFQTLLEGIVANPDQAIATLPLLTQAERQQLLVEWNDTRADYPRDRCIHQLFEDQVQRTPDALGLAFEYERLTYRELNRRANQLAHHLRRLGIGPERLVGICLKRSPEMVVVVLGVLKAGGAYVPLDPALPRERLAFMIGDTNLSLVVTKEETRERLAGLDAYTVCMDSEQEGIAQQSQENPESDVTAQNLAYVIYTSGSTGRPKGVMVEHGGLCNLATTLIRRHGLEPETHLLLFPPLSFDVASSQIFRTLCAGATLQLVSEEMLLDGPRLTQLVRDTGVTHLNVPPSALSLFAAETLPAVDTVIVGAEVCSPDLVARWAPGRRFFNAYGLTEATIGSTVFEYTPGHERLPIGRPLANVQIYLLDAHLQPMPVGVPGELCIGGVGLARGYLNRPDLTAEKFVPNPFSPEPGARLYRTGDLARYRPDGNIEFLGRLDHQVKIRGFRVELGEIEEALGQHPAVKQAVVLALEKNSGDRRLVAYVVASQPPPPTLSELRAFLKQSLPDYMIPSAFAFLDALPLSPSGKVNRQALLTPGPARPEIEERLVLPRTPLEEVLAEIWASVLGLNEVGVHDDFFDLGGHSLLATQVISRLRDASGIELPLRSLFETPTIAAFADKVEKATKGGEDLRTSTISPLPRESHRTRTPTADRHARAKDRQEP
jgi:amino acid adenylation domain-containing protein